MLRTFVGVCLLAFASCTMSGQAAGASRPAFEIADVQPSPHRTFPYFDGGGLRGDRYVLRQATMVDLIATAYGVDRDNVQGGPSWLEMDRFEVIAKAPPDTSKETLKLMLQSLLAERFKLVAHTGSKPMPAYVLSAAKPKMKESEGTGDPECHDGSPSSQSPAPGAVRYIMVACRNMTMERFAETLHGMANGYLDKPVVDETGLKGPWDIDIKWTGRGQLAQAGADGISIFDAVDKQLGLKLELKTAPRPVMIVDSVSEKPTPNPPGVEKALPPTPPGQFEVAVIKPAKPEDRLNGRINGDNVDLHGATLKFMITYAWDLNPNDNEVLVNAPKWLDVDKFDIQAKVATDSSAKAPRLEQDDLQQMLRALLTERFQMKTHMEDRPVSAYNLVAVSPKLRKADPTSRTKCTEGPGPDGKDPRIANPMLNRLLTCQNMTMAQIGDELQRVAAGYIYSSVVDATGIPGAWDFTLSFSSADKILGGATTKPSPDSSSSATPLASDPNGAVSLFDAVNRQLGLKLEKVKRPVPVLVIEHIEEKPTEN